MAAPSRLSTPGTSVFPSILPTVHTTHCREKANGRVQRAALQGEREACRVTQPGEATGDDSVHRLLFRSLLQLVLWFMFQANPK